MAAQGEARGRMQVNSAKLRRQLRVVRWTWPPGGDYWGDKIGSR